MFINPNNIIETNRQLDPTSKIFSEKQLNSTKNPKTSDNPVNQELLNPSIEENTTQNRDNLGMKYLSTISVNINFLILKLCMASRKKYISQYCRYNYLKKSKG